MTQTYTPRRSAEQWQSLIDQWQASGQSAKQFCQERALEVTPSQAAQVIVQPSGGKDE